MGCHPPKNHLAKDEAFLFKRKKPEGQNAWMFRTEVFVNQLQKCSVAVSLFEVQTLQSNFFESFRQLPTHSKHV